MAGIEQHFFNIAALGRSFQLGDVYNYRTDRILEDCRLWKEDPSRLVTGTRVDREIKKKLVQSYSDSSTTKWAIMEVDDHMRSSASAGFIETYKGASNYLKDKWSPTQVTRTLVCRVNLKKEHLENSILVREAISTPSLKFATYKIDDETCSIAEATHVVVGIDYGAEAYCVLTTNIVNETDVQGRQEAEEFLSKISLKMQNAIESKQPLKEFMKKFDGEEKRALSRLKCRMYDDLQVNSVECKISDAYQSCLKLMDVTNEQAVPISIQLCPLKAFMRLKKEAKELFEFGDANIDDVNHFCNTWMEFERVVMRANANCLLAPKTHRTAIRQFSKMVLNFQKKTTDDFADDLKRVRMKFKKFPCEQDTHLNNQLFAPIPLNRWLGYKKAEKEMSDILCSLEGVKMLANNDELETILKDPLNNKFAVVLLVPPLDGRTQELLDGMRTYRSRGIKWVQAWMAGWKRGDEEEEIEGEEAGAPWHMLQSNRKKIADLEEHAKRNGMGSVQFFVVFHQYQLCYSAYHAGNPLKDTFHRLPVPPTGLRVHLDSTGNASINVEWDFDYEDLGYPSHFLVEYRLKRSSDRTWMQQRTTKPGETKTTIFLDSGSAMEIRVAADTCIGFGEFSDVLDTEAVLGSEGGVSKRMRL